MDSSFKLGRIFGIPIGIHFSWLFVFFLFSFLLQQQFSKIIGAGPLQIWVVSVSTAVLFFLSVLAHELSHSLLAMKKGIHVHGITLFIFGGVSQLSREAQRPMTEFLIAVVGPLTSLVLAAICYGLWEALPDLNDSLSAMLFTLFAVNLSLGIFNLLPGFPLDGGRVLRAGVWGLSGSYWRGTQVAAWGGQVLGCLLIGIGIFWAVQQFGQSLQGLWLSLIGVFLFSTATISYRQEKRRESLRPYRVADAFRADWISLPAETPLGSPLVSHNLSRPDSILGVVSANQIVGIVTGRDLSKNTLGSSPFTTLAQVMAPMASYPMAGPADGLYEALERMESEGLDRVAVIHDGRLMGFLSRADARALISARPKNRF